MRVSARGLDGLVAEKLSEADEIVVVGGEVLGGKGVPQGMWVELDAHGEAVLLDDVADAISTKRAAALADEELVALNGRTTAQVVEEESPRFGWYRYGSLSVVLAVADQNGSTPL